MENTSDNNIVCNITPEKLKQIKDNPFREEFEGIVVKEKPIEQFRQEMVDDIFKAVTKETTSAAIFTKNGDYYNAKLAEAKIEGLHKALSIILEASTIDVKEK